jgi:hypothetical protein
LTLCAVWVRRVGAVEEMVFAADSRLRSGQAWDGCPKIMALPRSDCLISFAGNTHYAYPMLQQMANSISFYVGSRTRRLDIEQVRGHTMRIFDQMRELITDLPKGQEYPDDPTVALLFGGYSWRRRKFLLWQIYFDDDAGKFRHDTVGLYLKAGDKAARFAGNHVSEAKRRLYELLKERGRLGADGLDMEPYEVLHSMVDDGAFPEIGGPPQLAKVYRHLNTQFFAIPWAMPSGKTELCLVGRPLLRYEKREAPTLTIEGVEGAVAVSADTLLLVKHHG